MNRVFLICALVCVACVPAWAGQPSSFEIVMQHYEPIRLALMADSLSGVAEHGRAISTELKALQADFRQERAGASDEAMRVVGEKLAKMIISANDLADAGTLEEARSALYELSMPLVRWREGVAATSRPSVAYCSMHKKSWLQPGETIGNPYGGMPRCGKIVSK